MEVSIEAVLISALIARNISDTEDPSMAQSRGSYGVDLESKLIQ